MTWFAPDTDVQPATPMFTTVPPRYQRKKTTVTRCFEPHTLR